MEISPIKISIKGLSVYAHHGVFDFEKAYGQELLIDAEVTVAATSSDDIANTLSYADLADALVNNAKQNPVDLLETLAQRLLELTFSFQAVSKAKITVHKPNAPLTHKFEDVSVTVKGKR
ncbi:MAG: dihydroneopterin aldolase [Micrococcales bacterium]